MTFSMIAYNKEEGLIGSVVASKWTGVGGCVQFFRPGIGFLNIQNHSSPETAHSILRSMENGFILKDSVGNALDLDPACEKRQCIAADFQGNFYGFSGSECSAPFKHQSGNGCIAAGNTLSCKEVVDNMISAYETSLPAFGLAESLLKALQAGQDAGGDSRGQEAAAIKVYKTTYPMQKSYPIDLRVDSHENAIEKLLNLYDIFKKEDRLIVEK